MAPVRRPAEDALQIKIHTELMVRHAKEIMEDGDISTTTGKKRTYDIQIAFTLFGALKALSIIGVLLTGAVTLWQKYS